MKRKLGQTRNRGRESLNQDEILMWFLVDLEGGDFEGLIKRENYLKFSVSVYFYKVIFLK